MDVKTAHVCVKYTFRNRTMGSSLPDLIPLSGKGPAVIEQSDTTTIVEPGQRVRMDDQGNLVLTGALVGQST